MFISKSSKCHICNCDWWISMRFYFKVPCLWASCFGQLSTCLLRFLRSVLTRNVVLGPTFDNKAKSASFPRKKIPSRFPSLLRSQELSSVFAFAQPCGQNCHNITSSKQLLHSRFLLPLNDNFLLLSAHIKTFLSFIDTLFSRVRHFFFPYSLSSAPWGNMRRIF